MTYCFNSFFRNNTSNIFDYNDIITLISVTDSHKENQLFNDLIINGPLFIIDNPYVFIYDKDQAETISFNTTFIGVVPEPETKDIIIHVGDSQQIPLSQCTSIKQDTNKSSFNCTIQVKNNIPKDLSLYIGESVNKNKIKYLALAILPIC